MKQKWNYQEKKEFRERLENRLIDFSVRIIKISEELPGTRAGSHISGQLVRSGTSPALNYGEAQSAESQADFIHKMKICLKELRETMICQKIIYKKPFIENMEKLESSIKETDELISIFVASIHTASRED